MNAMHEPGIASTNEYNNTSPLPKLRVRSVSFLRIHSIIYIFPGSELLPQFIHQARRILYHLISDYRLAFVIYFETALFQDYVMVFIHAFMVWSSIKILDH